MLKKKNLIQKLFGRLASGQILEESTSEVNPLLEVLSVGDKIMLNGANTNYSYGGLHRVFQKVLKKVNIRERKISEVLILGFGTGSVASILKEELGINCRIIIV